MLEHMIQIFVMTPAHFQIGDTAIRRIHSVFGAKIKSLIDRKNHKLN